jgi:hypothetical protein
MVHSYGLGRGFMALMNHVPEVAEPKIEEIPVKKKPVIDWAFDNTVVLLEKMGDRRRELEASIARAQEELRQVNIVLDGADQMLRTIANGRSEISDEVKTAMADEIMEGLANLK